MLDLKGSGTTAAELPRTTAFTNLSMLFAGMSFKVSCSFIHWNPKIINPISLAYYTLADLCRNSLKNLILSFMQLLFFKIEINSRYFSYFLVNLRNHFFHFQLQITEYLDTIKYSYTFTKSIVILVSF